MHFFIYKLDKINFYHPDVLEKLEKLQTIFLFVYIAIVFALHSSNSYFYEKMHIYLEINLQIYFVKANLFLYFFC